ncbi:hypothetical protein C1I95_09525 [Micromonospora craterilacus]|uniref:Uncharacterized protein n=1 Tax=Micromonospora craterilacus TaxID=1655439 RepID=A0A2W2E827_9ACTN|nr:hypothetical protein C1I95_09525 [Micromonospora craterilacus]
MVAQRAGQRVRLRKGRPGQAASLRPSWAARPGGFAGAQQGGPNGEVWLIRPDAHLAWRGQSGADGPGRWLDAALLQRRV